MVTKKVIPFRLNVSKMKFHFHSNSLILMKFIDDLIVFVFDQLCQVF